MIEMKMEWQISNYVWFDSEWQSDFPFIITKIIYICNKS